MIGKSAIRNEITTTAGIPAPNQITISGAIATIGIVWSRTAYGKMLRSISLLCDLARATDIPTRIAAPKPISADRNVEIRAPTRLCRFSIQASTTSVGAGSKNRGMLSVRQSTCQVTTKTMKTRIGGAAARIQPIRRDGSGRGADAARVVVDVDLRSM